MTGLPLDASEYPTESPAYGANGCVFLVDDDVRVLRGLTRLIESYGMMVHPFGSAEQFLSEANHDAPGCLVVDHVLTGMTGLELLSHMDAGGTTRPTIFLSGRADIVVSVKAMKAGAVDFLVKPVDDAALIDAIRSALELDAGQREFASRRAYLVRLLATLSERERQVLDEVIRGRLNKQIANHLGIVEKTVKVHRARVYAKLGVRSVADLVRMVDFAR